MNQAGMYPPMYPMMYPPPPSKGSDGFLIFAIFLALLIVAGVIAYIIYTKTPVPSSLIRDSTTGNCSCTASTSDCKVDSTAIFGCYKSLTDCNNATTDLATCQNYKPATDNNKTSFNEYDDDEWY